MPHTNLMGYMVIGIIRPVFWKLGHYKIINFKIFFEKIYKGIFLIITIY